MVPAGVAESLEELLEMVGMSIFLVTFIGYLAAIAPRLEVRFVDSDQA